MSVQTYRVAWPYANVRIIDPATGSPTVAGLTKDTPVPAAADPADVKRLVAKGALVAVGRPKPEPESEPAKEKADEPKRVAAKPRNGN